MELIDIATTIKDVGIGVIALVILYVTIRQRGTADEREDAKDTAFINLIQSLAANVQASTASLQLVHKGIEDAHTKMGSITERRDAQLVQLQASIDKLPASLKAALISDFESVGNLIASVNQGVLALNQDVQKAFSEYAKMGAKLQAALEPPFPTSGHRTEAGGSKPDEETKEK